MNSIITITTIIILGISFLPDNSFAADEKYYVTQNGNGVRSGKNSSNAWSVSDFNNSRNWSSNENTEKIDPGDTVYFSGTINSRIFPAGSGSNGKPIILDGYAPGDCDPINSICNSSALLTNGFHISGGQDYLTVQDLRMTNQNFMIYTASGTDNSIGIKVKNNYIYDTEASYFSVSRGSAPQGPKYLTIEGNKMVGFGRSVDTPHGLQLNSVSDVIFRNNSIGHTGYTVCSSANVIEVHQSTKILFEYNDIYGAPQQAGIAVKEYGSNNIVIRYNKIHDNGRNPGGRAVAINWPETYNIYIYSNAFYDNAEFGIDVFDGCHDVYIWSNLIYNNVKQGLVTWYESGRQHGYNTDHHLDNIVIYNNTFANNGTDAIGSRDPDHTGLSLKDSGGTNHFVKNNVFYNNRPNGSTYHQIYVSDGLVGDVDIEHNTYYYSGKPPTSEIIFWSGALRKLTQMQGLGYEDDEIAGNFQDPGFVDPDNHNYSIKGDSINNGANLSECFYLNVQGEELEICFDDALYPDGTDWTKSPPKVMEAKRDSRGASWFRGAYIPYTGILTKDELSPPKGLKIVQ